jgi:hypothetical protein
VVNAGGHKRNPNGILDLLCKEDFPSLVEYARVMGLTYSFEHYTVAPNTVDRDDREFNNKVRVGESRAMGKSFSHYIV